MEQPQEPFDVRQWSNRKGRIAQQIHVSRPYRVSCWTKTSVKKGRHILYGDETGLLKFSRPVLPADLNAGFPDKFIRKDPADHAPVEQVAKAILHAKVPLSEADVVTFRNNLNKISLTPLNRRDKWIIHGCSMPNGPLFLDIDKSGGSNEPQHLSDGDRFMYYGYKFEQLCTEEDPGQQEHQEQHQDHEEGEVDATSEFGAVVRLRIGEMRVMMGAEIDCFDADRRPRQQQQQQHHDSGSLDSFIELKTYKPPDNQRQMSTLLRFKYPRWWVQSWLGGVPRIALGARDDRGMLQDVEVVNTTDLPGKSAAGGHSWNPWEFIGFAHDMLSWMRARASEHPGQHLTFTHDPETQKVIARVDPDGDLPSRVSRLLQPAK